MTLQFLTRSSIATHAALALVLFLPSLFAQTVPNQPASSQPNKPPTRVRVKLDGFDISSRAGQSPNQIGAASRGRTAPVLYAPVLGKTYTLHPQFHWEAADPDSKVTFHLMTPDGRTVFEAAASGGHLDYPADAPALTPGSTYRWTVIPADDDLFSGLPAPASLVVVSGAERDSIATELKNLPDPAAEAKVFVSHRVWYDAIQTYSDLLDHAPTDENARAARAQLYDQLTVTKSLAEADWKQVR